MHLTLQNNYHPLVIPTYYPSLNKLPAAGATHHKPINLEPLKHGRSPDYAVETYDIIQKDGVSSLLGKDRETPPVTWLGKALDWLIGNKTRESQVFEEVEETMITKPTKEDLTCKTISVKSKEQDEKQYDFSAALRIFRMSSIGFKFDYPICEEIADRILDRFSECIKKQIQKTNANPLTDKKITVYLLSKTDSNPSFAIDVQGIDESLLESMQNDCGVFAMPRKLRSLRNETEKTDSDKIIVGGRPNTRHHGSGSCDTTCVIVTISLLGGVGAAVAVAIGITVCVICVCKK